jgi:hypothetical protein
VRFGVRRRHPCLIAAPDDAGTRTADLYDWQAAIAATDGLRIALDTFKEQQSQATPCHRRIVCEHHEDWSVLEDDASNSQDLWMKIC